MHAFFGLTGTGTLVVAIVLFLGMTASAIVGWDRLKVLGRWMWPARAGVFAGAQVAAVLVAALALNNSFGFYQSWGELFGQHPSHDQPAAAAGLLDRQLAPELARDARAGVGTLTRLSIPGTRSGVHTGAATVYLPAQYGDPAYRDRTFPVVELLDGYPGSPNIWTHFLHLATVLDTLIATGRSAPFIAVLPVQNVDLPRDTECVNVSGGPQVDTYLTYDVRSAVVRSLRASTSGAQWTVMGYSTGGYCATDLALQHPTLFSAGASLDGYNAPAHDSTTQNLFGKQPWLSDLYSPIWLVQKHRVTTPSHLLLVSTKADRSTYLAATQLADTARPPVYVSTLTLPRGGHNFATFSAELPAAFGWLSRYVAGPLAPIPTVDGLTPTPAQPTLPVRGRPGHGRGANHQAPADGRLVAAPHRA